MGLCILTCSWITRVDTIIQNIKQYSILQTFFNLTSQGHSGSYSTTHLDSTYGYDVLLVLDGNRGPIYNSLKREMGDFDRKRSL